MSTKEKAYHLTNQKDLLLGNIEGWLQDLNERDYSNNSEYSDMKHRSYYYASTTAKRTENKNISAFEIGGLKLKILADLNPISEIVTFKTHKHEVNINDATGGSFIEIPELKIMLKVVDYQNQFWFKNQQYSRVQLLVKYFDSIIEHFKEDSK